MPIETNVNSPTLESTYELGRLDALARHTDKALFVTLLMSVFGTDLPVATYLKLRAALHEGNIANPSYRIDAQESTLARYDGASRTIVVAISAIAQARDEAFMSVNLFNAMTRAFGEYLRSVIRRDIDERAQERSPESQAETAHDVGTDYAAMMFFYGASATDHTVYANYAGEDLRLTMPTLEPLPQTAAFVAGNGHDKAGSFGHEALERGLASVGFTDEERRSIYFGNWLRDHSQLLDPKIVRKPDEPKNFPSTLSRAALTKLVDLLALKEFHDLQDTPAGRRAYTVDEEKLGVYRPSEHIDNPLNPASDSIDPQAIDPDFEPLVKADDPLLRVHPARSISNYVDHAARYMYNKLIDAMNAGNTIEGRRYFGEALHVLEDYFSHSNFVELCLRKKGHEVLPWTTETDCKHGLPIVTGMFGGLDVIASIAEPLGQIFFETKALDFKRTKPGDRSDAEQALLILLAEHPTDVPLSWLKTYLELRDKAAAAPLFGLFEAGRWITQLPLTLLQNAINSTMQGMLNWVADSVDEYQTLSGHNPNEKPGLHPTHSQLAKDHDTHPFHELAAYLATYAVEQVGRSMYEFWQGNTERDPASVAMNFILHPDADNWHEDIVAAWEAKDPDGSRNKIQAGSRLEDLVQLQAQLEREEKDRVRVLGEQYRNAPNTVSEIISSAFPFG
ncbi:hypothetical protein C4Q28_06755 [Pseudomonas sp. SWI6]|uniref:HET-C-related protein n=1 Tax=unclassified Pseudomonas TaxID=196821 RepID=UPI000CE5E789|nr:MULTISPECIES: HET-C-related protein [unclassified Pseudomonas]AVD81884.1 hypothetical protein C4Q28_06755 [Pseudomonas sp. SWI6]AVD88836.1 hypothetical protein C4Q26_17525 [Pseudomonas sp. SWI44]QQZ35300.1 hypothetical protein IF103_19045 [Pseudomonas sp. SK2]